MVVKRYRNRFGVPFPRRRIAHNRKVTSVDGCDKFCARIKEKCYGYSFNFARKFCVAHIKYGLDLVLVI